jgi:hypothetical protein
MRKGPAVVASPAVIPVKGRRFSVLHKFSSTFYGYFLPVGKYYLITTFYGSYTVKLFSANFTPW